MNYAKIKNNCTSNGIGIRVAIFFSGCEFHCDQCQNTELWNRDYGEKFTDAVKQQIFDEVKKAYYDGISLLGGEPLMPYNVDEITQFVKEFKAKYPKKTVWLYTGYTFNTIKSLEIMQYVDIVVDGLYVEELYSPKLYFRGSKNQNLIDVKASLKANKIILAKSYYEMES